MIVNGGNCRFGDVNWVHYLNAVYVPGTSGGWPLTLYRKLASRLYAHEDRVALRAARLIIANSERSKADLINWLESLRSGFTRSITATILRSSVPRPPPRRQHYAKSSAGRKTARWRRLSERLEIGERASIPYLRPGACCALNLHGMANW